MRWQDRGLVDGGEALRLSLWEMEIVEREDVYACIQANEHIKRVTLPHAEGPAGIWHHKFVVAHSTQLCDILWNIVIIIKITNINRYLLYARHHAE